MCPARTRRRHGDIAAGADLDMLADLAYGVLWYRLPIAHAPLDADGLAASPLT